MSAPSATVDTQPRGARIVTTGALLLLVAVSALFFYKWGGAFRALQRTSATGRLAVAPDVLMSGGVVRATQNYFARVWPALAYGVVIGALVRSTISPAWVARWLGRGDRGSNFSEDARGGVAGAVAGAPLMLCSCCVTPIFTGVYERGARLGSALSMMLAAPGLNVAALLLTFMLLPAPHGVIRTLTAATIVLALAPAIGAKLEGTVAAGKTPRASLADEPMPATFRELVARFARSLGYMVLVTVPILVVGVAASSVLLPHAARLPSVGGVVAVVAVALVGTLIALPTFFELPLAAMLLQLGAPGAAVALLVAGPIVNLPSLLVLGRETNARVALAVGAAVWAASTAAGLVTMLL
ncbi:MAG: permease [Deltaproteobacteria bacterium]|nr:permease [Deltaproteobacteria bacterium]